MGSDYGLGLGLLVDEDLGSVRLATLQDLPYVISLSKKESSSLGFIPKMAYEAAITGIKTGDRWSNVCNDKLFIIATLTVYKFINN